MAEKVTILDGGMGRELLRMGAPFRQPEWSALALSEAPEFVVRAHRAFIDAGAEVITTNSYAIVPFHIGEERFADEALPLARLAGHLAREAAATTHGVAVAGSLPPLFGSYRPDLFQPARAPEILKPLVDGLSPSVDYWLAETQGSTQEAVAVRVALGQDPRPLWLSFTLADTLSDGRAVLRSGEAVHLAAHIAAELGAAAMLFNCSPPEVMEAAILEARDALPSAIKVGVYANAFAVQARQAANAGLSTLRDDSGPNEYLRQAQCWSRAGAVIIGGCCGIGPEHISVLTEAFASPSNQHN